MTHDELIKKIQNHADENPLIAAGDLDSVVSALLRVLQMHKPQEITLPNGEWGTNCALCDGFEYPCPTVFVIYSELW